MPLIIVSLIIFPWQLIAFTTLIIQEDRPNSTHAYAIIKEERVLMCDSCVQLRIIRHVELLPEETERKCFSFDFSCSAVRKGEWRTAGKFINSTHLPVKASAFSQPD